MQMRGKITNPGGFFGKTYMNTRRHFLRTAGMMAGGAILLSVPASGSLADEPDDCTLPPSPTPAVPFEPGGEQTINIRKNAAHLTAGEVDRLKAAYGALRKLAKDDPKDPRGWLQQANVHCWYCGGGSNLMAGEEIHGSWWFFPWHRCYLYFHERILGKLIGDPTLRLAYWDWADPNNRSLPDPFLNPNDVSNPLFDANRGTGPADKLPDSLVGPTIMDNVMGQVNYQRFMGTDADLANSQGGRLEFGPHGAVHVWVGSPGDLSVANPDMGVLSTAAQDPIFFAHHSNIDRLWDVWLRSAPTIHANPSESKWLDHRWTFYDENKRLTSISVRDVLDHENNLHYSYESTAMNQHPLVQIAAPPKKIELTPEPMIIKAPELSPAVRARLQAAQAGAPVPTPHYVLHIDGVEVPPNRTALVRVFVNNPQANAKTSIESAAYIGYFTILAKTSRIAHAMKEHPPTNVALDLTAKIGKLLKDQRELSVTLVPVGAVDAKPKDIKLSFKKVYITEE
jgi:polyphenol oxidase